MEQLDNRENCALGRVRADCLKANCATCGWYKPEIARRKELPLVKGEDGLWRKIIGKAPEGEREQ